MPEIRLTKNNAETLPLGTDQDQGVQRQAGYRDQTCKTSFILRFGQF